MQPGRIRVREDFMTSTTEIGQGAGPAPAYEVPTKAWAARRVGDVLISGLQERCARREGDDGRPCTALAG